MEFLLFLIMVVLGLIGSFFSGLLGIGGTIITFPLLLFVPPFFGATQFTSQEVSAISMFQVLFSSLAGVLAYRRSSKNQVALVHKSLVMYMGSGILLGSFIGGLVSGFLDSSMINLIYGIVAIIAVVLMLIPSKGSEEARSIKDISVHKTFSFFVAFLVGIISGIVGAGGAFILIPIMLTVLKIPTRVAIATSLAIVFISSLGGVAGKVTTVDIPWLLTAFTVLGSLLGAPLGSRVSARINVKYLRYALIVLIAATAIKVWTSVL